MKTSSKRKRPKASTPESVFGRPSGTVDPRIEFASGMQRGIQVPRHRTSMIYPARVTHQDIANKFGCDKSTVSLALRDNPRIPAATRKQIRELAEKMGYRPDPALAILARQRWAKHDPEAGSTLAFIVNRKRPFYVVQAPYIRGAKERAIERGYQLLEFDLDEYPSGHAASKVLYNRGIRGLILACIPPDELAPIVALDWDKFTVVSLSHGWGHVPVHAVGINYFASTRMVWQEVAARGYQRIGTALFQENPTSIVDAERLGACYIAQRDLVSPDQRIPVLLCDFDNKGAFFSWFKQHRPDVVISRWAGVYDWLVEEGYKIPRDVAFASFRIEAGRPIAGASMMVDHIGSASVDAVIAQMHENRWGIPEIRQTLQLEPVWVNGASLPTRKVHAAK